MKIENRKIILIITIFLALGIGGYFWLGKSAKFATIKSGWNMALKEVDISNGMKLVTYESHRVPLVTLVLTVKAGARTETPETSGLTHLWEHMFFKGNKKLPDQAAFQKRIRQLGISYNGDTDSEKVRYYFTMPSAFLEQGIEFMADAIATPLLDQVELDKEIQVVMNEYERNASSPMFEYFNLKRHLLYGEMEHLRDPLGLRKTILGATREKLFDIKDKTMVPANSALIVSGDIDPVKTKELVEKHFAIWQTPKEWEPIKDLEFPPLKQHSNLVLYAEHVFVPYYSLTFAAPRAKFQERDSHIADVLLQLLQHKNSKFTKKFLDTKRTFDAGLDYYTQSQAATMSIYAQTHRTRLEGLTEAFLDEVKLWTSDGYFSNEQLEDIRRNLIIEKKMEQSAASEYAKTLGFWWAVTGLDYYNNYLNGLLAIEIADIQDFVKRWFIDKPYIEFVVLSPQDGEKIKLKENARELAVKYLGDKYSEPFNITTDEVEE